MSTCRECHDLLWDYVYDLLDAAETERLREHLARCPACQSELDDARTERKKIKAVALLPQPVPEFYPPVEEPATLPLIRSIPAAARKIHRGAWLQRLAVAAALLLALGVPFAL